MLAGLQGRVLRNEFIDYVVCGLRDELQEQQEALDTATRERPEEKHRIEVELKRLVDSIAARSASPSIMAAIGEREARIRVITNKLVEPGPGSFQEKLDELRTLAMSRLTRLSELLTDPSAIHEARALLAEQVGKFTLHRVQEGESTTYKASGKIDFFGEVTLTQLSGAGARIVHSSPRVDFEIEVAA
jgi:hypothetical protein